jgi:GNAT superfamily N-acetyltransferase
MAIDGVLSSAGLRLMYFAYTGDSGSQQFLLLEGQYKAGWLNYDVCLQCRRGHIWKLTIDDEHQRQGVGSLMLEAARRRHPGVRWTTSGQRREAKEFWAKVGARTGAGYQAEKPCPCLRNSTGPWRRRIDRWRMKRALEFPPLRRSGGYLLPVGAGVRLSGSVCACQADSYSSGLR